MIPTSPTDQRHTLRQKIHLDKKQRQQTADVCKQNALAQNVKIFNFT